MKINTKDLDQQVAVLLKMRDEDIDTSDIPEVRDWSGASVGRFYRPLKEPITIRLDSDLVAQLKASGPGYQTRINSLLRSAIRASSGPSDVAWRMERDTERTSSRARPLFRFEYLEKRSELAKWGELAEVIERRGSVFAHAS